MPAPAATALTAAAIARPSTDRTIWFFASTGCVVSVKGTNDFEAARCAAAQRLGVPQSALVLKSRRG